MVIDRVMHTSAAWAIITVNVYFLEKAVKDAYKSLDDMLLKNAEKQPATDKQPSTEPAQSDTKPGAEHAQSETKPQSGIFYELPSISLCAVAHAAEKESDTLDVEMASMPEVMKAYDEMNKRLPRLFRLFKNGAVGLTNQVLGRSAATYADTERDAAKPGWWIQLQNGRWLQK